MTGSIRLRWIRLVKHYCVAGFCVFIALINFKPSEPYLSAYLTCNSLNQNVICQSASQNSQTCESSNYGTCSWTPSTSILSSSLSTGECVAKECVKILADFDCGGPNSSSNYCEKDESTGFCVDTKCYKYFTENQVNNEIFPWSTFAYFPLLLTFGLLAEIYSYRYTILFGIFGRVITRFLLLFGESLLSMQLMQITFSMGTAAEDVFKAYIYYAIAEDQYQKTTSYIACSALLSSVCAGLLGDLLVVRGKISLDILMIISAFFVCAGAVVGVIFIQHADSPTKKSMTSFNQSVTPSNKSVMSLYKPMILEQQNSLIDMTRIAFRSLLGQLRQLYTALQSTFLRAFVLWWIWGNATYTILYSYEVSVFKELNGNDNWNGTALASMLLLGAVGAMIPLWLGVDKWDLSGIESVINKKISHSVFIPTDVFRPKRSKNLSINISNVNNSKKNFTNRDEVLSLNIDIMKDECAKSINIDSKNETTDDENYLGIMSENKIDDDNNKLNSVLSKSSSSSLSSLIIPSRPYLSSLPPLSETSSVSAFLPPSSSSSQYSSSSSSSSSPDSTKFSIPLGTILLILLAGLFSVISLFFFLFFWSLLPSVLMLGLFFSSWQCVTVVLFTQLALSLKRLTAKEKEFNLCKKSSIRWNQKSMNNECYEDIKEELEEEEIKEDEKEEDEDEGKNVNISITINPLPQHEYLILSQKSHKHLNESRLKEISSGVNMGERDSPNGNLGPSSADDFFIDNSRPFSDNSRPFSDNNRPYSDNSMLISDNDRPLSDESRPFSNYSRPFSDNSRPFSDNSRPFSDNSRPFGDHSILFGDNDRAISDIEKVLDEENMESGTINFDYRVDKKKGKKHDVKTSPPYSLAVVAVIGASAILQSVYQALLFSILELPLRSGCTVLVLVHTFFTILFALPSLYQIRQMLVNSKT